MRRNHIVIGAVALVATALGSITLLIDPGFFDAASAPLIAFGLVAVAVSGLGGLLLARAPWGRWTLVGTVTAGMLFVSGSGTWLVWVTYLVGGTALLLLLGPWIRLWIRHHAAVDSPGPVPLILMSVGVAAPLVIGLLAFEGATVAHWVLAGVAMLSAFFYGRGNPAGTWMLRIVVPASAALLVAVDPQPGSWAILFLAVIVAVLAFLPAAGHTTVFITPPLPSPARRGDVSP